MTSTVPTTANGYTDHETASTAQPYGPTFADYFDHLSDWQESIEERTVQLAQRIDNVDKIVSRALAGRVDAGRRRRRRRDIDLLDVAAGALLGTTIFVGIVFAFIGVVVTAEAISVWASSAF